MYSVLKFNFHVNCFKFNPLLLKPKGIKIKFSLTDISCQIDVHKYLHFRIERGCQNDNHKYKYFGVKHSVLYDLALSAVSI